MQKIGLAAVMDMTSFTKGMTAYNKGLGIMSNNTSKAGKLISTSLKVIGGVTVGAATAIGAIGGAAMKLASDARAIPGITAAFNNLGGSIERMRAGSAGMIADVDLMKEFNRAATLVSQDFAQKLPDAMQYLQRVSAATGDDMGYMLNSLTLGVGRLSPMIIDNLGIQVKLSDAYEVGAKALGKSVKEMTKAEQQTALMNMVMAKLEEKYGAVPGLAGTAAQSFASLNVTLKNVKDAIGVALIPAMNELLKPLSELAGVTGDKVVAWAQKIGPILAKTVANGVTTATKAINAIIKTFDRLTEKISYVIGVAKAGFAGSGVAGGAAGFLAALGIPENITATIHGILTKVESAIRTGIDKIRTALSGAGGVVGFGETIFETLKANLPASFRTIIEEIIPELIGTLIELPNRVIAGFQEGGISGGFSALLEGVFDVAGGIRNIRQGILTGLLEIGQTLLTKLGEMFPDLQPFIETFLQPILGMGQRILTIVFDLQAQIGPALGQIFSAALPMLQTIIGNVMRIIEAAIPVVQEFVGSAISSLINAFQNLAPIVGQASTVIADLAVQAFPILATIISKVLDLIPNLIPIIGSLVDIFGTVASVVLRVAGDVFPKVIDVVTRVAGIISQHMPAIQSIVEMAMSAIEAAWNAVWPVASMVVDVAMKTVENVINQVIPVILKIANDVFPKVVEAVQKLGSVVREHLPQIQSIIETAMSVISTIIDRALTIILAIWNAVWPVLSNVVDAALGAIGPIVSGVLNTVEGIINTVMSVIQGDWEGAWNGIKDILEGVWDIIVSVIEGAQDLIKAAIEGIIGMSEEELQAAAQGWLESAGEWIENLVAGIENGATDITDKIEWMIDVVIMEVKKKATEFIKIGDDIVQGIVNGITGAIGSVKAAAKKVADAIPTGVKKLLGIGSPSKVMAQVGLETMLGLVKGIDAGEAKVMKTVSKVVKEVIGSFERILDLQERMGGTPGQLPEKIAEWLSGFTTVVRKIIDAIGTLNDAIGYKRIKELDKTATRFRRMIEAVMVDFTAIKNVDLPDMDAWSANIVRVGVAMVNALTTLVATTGQSSLKLAARFADIVKTIFSFVQDGVDVLATLAEYTPVQNIGAKIENFVARMMEVIPALRDLAHAYDKGKIEYANTILTAMKGVTDIVKPGIDAIKALVDYNVVKSLSAKAQNFKDRLMEIVNVLSETADDWATEAMQAAAEFYDAATNVLGIVQPGIEAIVNLTEYDEQESLQDRVTNLRSRLMEIVDTLKKSWDEFDQDGVNAAKVFYEATQNIVNIVKPAIDAIITMVSYEVQESVKEQVENMRARLMEIVDALKEGWENFDTEGVESAQAFYSAAQTMFGVVKPAIDAITALTDYTRVANLAQKVTMFKLDLHIIVDSMDELADQFIGRGLPDSAETAAAMQTIVGVVKPAIDALALLAVYPKRSRLNENMEQFKTDLHSLLGKINKLAQHWATVGLGAAQTFSDSVTKTFGFIKPAIALLGVLAKYPKKIKLNVTMERFKKDLQNLLLKINKMAKSWLGQGTTDAENFSQAVQTIVEFVKPALDALDEMAKYKSGELAGAMQDFADDILDLVDTIQTSAQRVALAQFDAGVLAQTVITISQAIRTGLDATIVEMSSAGFDAAMFRNTLASIVEDILYSITAATTALTSGTEISDFTDAVGGIVTGIQEAFDELTTLGSGGISQAMTEFVNAIKQGLTNGRFAVIDGIQKIIADMAGLNHVFYNTGWQAGNNWISGLISGMQAKTAEMERVATNLGSIANDAFASAPPPDAPGNTQSRSVDMTTTRPLAAATTSISRSVSVNIGNVTISNGMDLAEFRTTIRDEIINALGGD